MLVRVRTGYGYFKGNRSYQPGEIVDLTDAEYQAKHWIFESAEPKSVPEVEPEKESAEESSEDEKAEPEVLENRAVLDSKAGAPLVRKRQVRTK